MKLKYTFEKMVLDDQAVVVPVGDKSDEFKGIIKLNESAELIFDMLQQGDKIEKIVNELLKKYDVTYEDALKSVDYVIEKLSGEGVLE